MKRETDRERQTGVKLTSEKTRAAVKRKKMWEWERLYRRKEKRARRKEAEGNESDSKTGESRRKYNKIFLFRCLNKSQNNTRTLFSIFEV